MANILPSRRRGWGTNGGIRTRLSKTAWNLGLEQMAGTTPLRRAISRRSRDQASGRGSCSVPRSIRRCRRAPFVRLFSRTIGTPPASSVLASSFKVLTSRFDSGRRLQLRHPARHETAVLAYRIAAHRRTTRGHVARDPLEHLALSRSLVHRDSRTRDISPSARGVETVPGAILSRTNRPGGPRSPDPRPPTFRSASVTTHGKVRARDRTPGSGPTFPCRPTAAGSRRPSGRRRAAPRACCSAVNNSLRLRVWPRGLSGTRLRAILARPAHIGDELSALFTGSFWRC